MERGPELASTNTMSSLLYRGHAYVQQSETAQQPCVQLTYRRHVYQARVHNVKPSGIQLTYRGLHYTR